MRIFLAGASGVIGVRLIPLLVNLLAAARAAGAARFLAQSIAWTPPSGGEPIAEHERLVLDGRRRRPVRDLLWPGHVLGI